MSKYFADRRREDDHNQSLQMLRDSDASGQSQGQTPPELNLAAGSGSPIQAKFGEGGFSHEKSDYLEGTRFHNERSVEKGDQPDKPDFKAQAHIASGERELWKASTLTEEEQKQPLNTLYADSSGKASGSIGTDGARGKVEGEASARLINYEREFPFTFEHNMLGEDMEMFLALVVKGMVGAEAKAGIEGRVQRAQASKDPSAVNSSGFKAGLQAEASAFAGAKVSLGGKAAYRWKKKQQSSYKSKIAQSADMIIDSILLINPPLGWLLKKMGATKAINYICNVLFGLGKEGKVDLGIGEAEVEGSAGVGGEAGAGMGFANGKFSFYANAKATWGLGFGTKVKVSLDLVEGLLFGMVQGGELWSRAKDHLGKVINPSALYASMGSIWSGITGWFSSDDKVREITQAGAHTLAPAAKRAEMLKALMSGWTGDDDQEAMLKILRFSAQNGDLGRVYLAAGGRSTVLGELDGSRRRQAEAL